MRLRIIAGKLGGRMFEAPGSAKTHPMSERVRAALFNMLGDISGKTVLEPFAGSGALSFEALSRGATHATLLDNDKQAQRSIEINMQALDLKASAKLIKANCRVWSAAHQAEQFDLILVDPPYNNLQLSTVNMLVRHLKSNGLMVVSYPGRDLAPTVNGVVVVDNRNYGDAALAFYHTRQPS